MKLKFKQILESITGFSTPIFGISWNPPKSEKKTINSLIVFLEDKRAVYGPLDFWDGPRFNYYKESILNIREKITEIIIELDSDSKAVPVLKAMRATCRKFLSHPFCNEKLPHKQTNVIIGEFRGAFGVFLGQLCSMYGLEMEDFLIITLPLNDSDEPNNVIIETSIKLGNEYLNNRFDIK